MAVLRGGEKTILRTKPLIFIECHEKHIYLKYCKYLEAWGAELIKEYFGDGKIRDRLYGWG